MEAKNFSAFGLAGDCQTRVAYVLDPRFPGGTSSAVAQEINALAPHFDLSIHGISSGMFHGKTPSPALAQALQDNELEIVWDSAQIQADIAIVHNPSFLKFSKTLACRIFARQLYVVTHENFLRPGGEAAFDVAACLQLIDAATMAFDKRIAPISAHNRNTVQSWFQSHIDFHHWNVVKENWFNICDFDFAAPNPQPGDRRGRLSRPGFEKFPPLKVMEICFPETAESNLILGADNFLNLAPEYSHWTLVPFLGMDVAQFMDQVDFMVYFTSPCWQESFGRVIAEATAAGKMVITDENTASTFGSGVVSAKPSQVDQIIAAHIQNPEKYVERVKHAQQNLRQFGPKQFLQFFERQVVPTGGKIR